MLTNKDLNTLIRIKDLISVNEQQLFKTPTAHDDFIDFTNLIEKIIQNKKDISKRQNDHNKLNKEYHVIVNQISHYKKVGNIQKLDYWKQRLTDYKKRQRS